MATESPLMRHSQCTAAANLSATAGLSGPNGAGQFLAVKTTAGRAVNLASTGGEAIDGILQNDPVQGYVADVGVMGISKAVAGGSFSAGALLMTDTSARLITATTGNFAVAKALEASTGAGQIITVFVQNFGKQ
ncbi:hypothetical protein [Bradyrhizobium sp. ORS 86]|uniref:hypothetical protein n=1 Tax=Bradyrhizobium sp. ORS 86 TaxID=1685970 RepID=UPI0038904236